MTCPVCQNEWDGRLIFGQTFICGNGFVQLTKVESDLVKKLLKGSRTRDELRGTISNKVFDGRWPSANQWLRIKGYEIRRDDDIFSLEKVT